MDFNTTILTAKLPANKQISLGNNGEVVTKKNRPKYFNAEFVKFESIFEIWAQLKKMVKNPKKSLIRGIAGDYLINVRRTKEVFKEPAQGANWVMLDLDVLDKSPITTKIPSSTYAARW